MFKPTTSKICFPEMEKAILRFWKERDIFRRTVSEREGGPLFVLYEGPPTANGSPGIHHVLSRVFKDVIPRYKTMKGFKTLRKGGWDTHGLPVELEIEKELGLATKLDIENFGVEKFNQRCRESVFRYVKEWEAMTERVGFWVDMDQAYATLSNDYIETGWWILRQLWDRGLLYQSMKGAPHCPRCVTSLSSHEVALGYQENTPDPSVFVKFQVEHLNVTGQKPETKTFFLAWTTTPWTLPGNTALAVSKDEDYGVVEIQGDNGIEHLIMANALIAKVMRHEHRVVDTVKGSELVGLNYRPLYDAVSAGIDVRQFSRDQVDGVVSLQVATEFTPVVIAADFVSMEDGTGIVHIAPAFGDEDLEAGRKNSLAFVQHVDLRGCLVGRLPGAGKFVKDADKDIIRDIKVRGLLYHRDTYRHTYPFCWRCSTPLLYYAKNSWYIMTTMVKQRLLSGNQEVNWYPEHIKDGRFGEWLRNNVDWAISRERYWGTPIPIWECKSCETTHCVGSVAELREKALPDHESLLSPECLDLHRPHIDQVIIRCDKCGGDMQRVTEVMDAWFDSGAMPFAQWHYPFENGSLLHDGRFPSDYICEAVDQTRGWFYSLHAISTLITDRPCYRNVICLGLILDEKGEKMSKSRGNVVEPWAILDKHGADALRWYLFTSAFPGSARRFSSNLVQESLRRFLLTLWNTYSFFVTYANIDRFDPLNVRRYWTGDLGTIQLAELPRNDLDRWVLSELADLVNAVTDSLEKYSPTDACRRIEEFVEVLSNWYVRRSRRRFWKSGNDLDKEWAYVALYTCLVTISRILAPFTPFVSEEIYQNLVRSRCAKSPESVHLSFYPEPAPGLVDQKLAKATRLAMRISSLGRAARSKAGIKVRQPLARALVKVRFPEESHLLIEVQDQVLQELNVKTLEIVDQEDQLVEFSVRLNLAVLGPKYGTDVASIQSAFLAENQKDIVHRVLAKEHVAVGSYVLEPEEVKLIASDRSGLVALREGGYIVAVEREVSSDLVEEGVAREMVHLFQSLRRNAGLELTDHIMAYYSGDTDTIPRVVERFKEYIKQETLAEDLCNFVPESGVYIEKQVVGGIELTLGLKKAPTRNAQ